MFLAHLDRLATAITLQQLLNNHQLSMDMVDVDTRLSNLEVESVPVMLGVEQP